MRPAPSIPLRVALVTTGFDLGGGVPTIARWLCDCLRSTGRYVVDVLDLATSSRDMYSRRLLAPRSWGGSRLRGIASNDGVIHWGANAVEIEIMRYRPRRELTLRLQNYDIIQVVSGGPALAAAVVRAGVPTVLQVATTVEWERRRQIEQQTGLTRLWRVAMTALTTSIELNALRKVDVVLVENSAMLHYVRSIGHKHVVKVFPGVDTRKFYPQPAGWPRNGYLLSVCRLDDPRKGVDRIIRAYSRMVDANDSVPRLMLGGYGQLPEALASLIDILGLSSRVTVCSDISDRDLPDLYRGASIFVQTSHEEGLGLSVLEAMSCGLPVVCTETAGTKETVINGVTGWIVPQDTKVDVPQMVAARAFDLLQGAGAGFGDRARSRCVETFSSHVAIRRFTDTYDQLIGLPTTVSDAN